MPPARRLLAALALSLTLGSAGAQASAPAGCEVFWQLAPRWAEGGTPTQLELQLSIEGAAPVKQPRPDDNAALVAGPRQLAFAGRALLALPPALASRPSLQMCLQVEGLADGERFVSSLHPMPGDERLLRWQGPPALAREIVVAVGAWSMHQRSAHGQSLQVLAPSDLPGDAAEALADVAARTVDAQRRFWGLAEPAAAPQLVVIGTGRDGRAPLALGQHDALLLRLPPNAAATGAAVELLIAQASLRGLFRERFGPVAFTPRGDDAASAWFSDGFSLFYALRLRAAGGGWTADDLATALTMLWQQPGAAAAQPWLAAHWHSALLAEGRAGGLDAVLHRLLLPAAKARDGGGPFGPLSQPLAVHRLQAALRPVFGDAMRADLQRLAGAGAGPTAASLGPCFELDAAARRIAAVRDTASAACQAWLGTGRSAAAAAAAQAPKAAAGKASKTSRSAKAAQASRPAKAAPKRRKR